MKITLTTIFLILSYISLFAQEETYVKHLVFPKGACIEQKAEMAARLVPSPAQYAWQKLELNAFIHFGINTFTNREWGDGTEDPALFNPTDLDARQWIRTLKAGGFKMVILTAKHHDGFCLWQTKTTRHSVASSPWKDGKGDVVREVRDACEEYGMKFGVYLSPWDRNAECYGDSPAYNQFFINQLTELLTNYGEIDEVWFDGACAEGPNGKRQVYDWDGFQKVIRELQPNAVTAIMGDDVRWVGNENGIGRETEWSATALTPGIYPGAAEKNKKIGLYDKASDLGSRKILERACALYWHPSEVDVSIRPGWFYHQTQDDKVKSLKHLSDIYFKSVGYNSSLLLNIPPDTRGMIHRNDSIRLAELNAYITKTFSEDFVEQDKSEKRETDEGPIWTTEAGGSKEFKLAKDSRINTVMLQEDITRGQRVEAFSIDVLEDGRWKTVAEGTTIGYKRLVRFPAEETSALRVTIKGCRLSANISRVGAFYAMPLADTAVPRNWNDIDREQWSTKGKSFITIDFGRLHTLRAFTYAPSCGKNGIAYRYNVESSQDGKHWNSVIEDGEFCNIMHNPVPMTVTFDRKVAARFIRITAVSDKGKKVMILPEEIGFTKAKAKDDETLVYPNPAGENVARGEEHPTVKGWKLYTEYNFDYASAVNGLPKGFVEHQGIAMSRTARVDNHKCSKVTKDGILKIWSCYEETPVDNRFGKEVNFSHGCYRSAKPGSEEEWCNFTENMRIEVRFRRSDTKGFNNALWFMGNNSRPWPANGEIDLLENPKKKINQKAHFTLHSENHYAGVMGGKGSVTSTINLSDMTQWNIYWLEWYPDRIVGGVNGEAYFEHKKGADGNLDWPWSDPEGFFMIISTGISDREKAWPGKVDPSQWDPQDLPSMEVDWIRVWVNDSFSGSPAPDAKY